MTSARLGTTLASTVRTKITRLGGLTGPGPVAVSPVFGRLEGEPAAGGEAGHRAGRWLDLRR